MRRPRNYTRNLCLWYQVRLAEPVLLSVPARMKCLSSFLHKIVRMTGTLFLSPVVCPQSLPVFSIKFHIAVLTQLKMCLHRLSLKALLRPFSMKTYFTGQSPFFEDTMHFYNAISITTSEMLYRHIHSCSHECFCIHEVL